MGIIDNEDNIRPWLKPDDFIERLVAQDLFVYKKEHFSSSVEFLKENMR
jgi:hypothetical protein